MGYGRIGTDITDDISLREWIAGQSARLEPRPGGPWRVVDQIPEQSTAQSQR